MRVIGVYPVAYSEELLEQFVNDILPEGASQKDIKAACEEHRQEMQENMEGLHMIEAIVELEDGEYDLGAVTQDDPQTEDSQIPYDEAVLTKNGDDFDEPPQNGPARIAFFLHFCDPAEPLHTPEGTITLPPPMPLPDRLAQLMPYEMP